MTLRVAVTADNHWDASASGRLDECIETHDRMADQMQAAGVEVVCLAGDMYERLSRPDDRNAALRWVGRLVEFAEVIMVRGNHDVPRDLQAFAAVPRVRVFEQPAVVSAAGGRLGVAALPWPTKAALLARMVELGAIDKRSTDSIAGDAMRDVIRHLNFQLEELSTGGAEATLMIAHAQVVGSKTTLGQPLVGCDMELGLEDLALCSHADAIALGHIHCPQEWTWQINDRAMPIFYTGSPRRTAWGETEEKFWSLLTWEDGKDVEHIRWPTLTRAMHLHATDWRPLALPNGATEWGFTSTPENAPPNADVRFRYRVPTDQRAAAAAAAEAVVANLMRWVRSVKIEVEEIRADRPTDEKRTAYGAARTLEQKLDAWMVAKGIHVSDATRARLPAKIAAIKAAIGRA